MDTPRNMSEAVVFRSGAGGRLTALAVVVTVGALVAVVSAEGAGALVLGWPLVGIAVAGWWLFWYPVVVVAEDGVTVRNPLATIHVPWDALIDVDTRYALKLVTPTGSYTAWAAPAPGVWGTHAGKPEHVTDLPPTSYGPGGSIRPGDLKNTDSGHAAYLVRSRWQSLVESGAIDVDRSSRPRRSWHWRLIVPAVLLALAAWWTLALGR